MVSRLMANLSNYVKPSEMRRIVETHRHLRESHWTAKASFSPLYVERDRTHIERLYRPHTDKATVSRTGTRPPPSYGKGPTGVGESVMTLPGIPSNGCPQGLAGKGSDRQCLVQSRHRSRSAGKPPTWRSCDPFPRNDACVRDEELRSKRSLITWVS